MTVKQMKHIIKNQPDNKEIVLWRWTSKGEKIDNLEFGLPIINNPDKVEKIHLLINGSLPIGLK